MPVNTNYVVVREKIQILSFIFFRSIHAQTLLIRLKVDYCLDGMCAFKGGMTA